LAAFRAAKRRPLLEETAMRDFKTKTRGFDDPDWAWSHFDPTGRSKWDLSAAAHLHRRAGFTAAWAELERDLADGPAAAIDRLLAGAAQSIDGSPAAEFATAMDSMAAQLSTSASSTELQAIWLYRMIFTPHPLQERMTLFWHNHFATSIAKVQSPRLMQRQNDLFRSNALGDFRKLVSAVGKDPAMLIWLDSTTNRKAKPNENYAREVMELFTLGRGHYSEKDIQEAARAFTGWFVIKDQFKEVLRQHDDGAKTVLGQTGNWSGDDVPAILLKQSACAEFICKKLFKAFVSETHVPSDALVAPLARAFRDSGYQIREPVAMILRSNLFFDPAVRRRRVKSPVEFTVGTIRALEITNPTVQTSTLAEACQRMGQSLFAPPSVAGWEWGAPWINSTAMLARDNLVLGLLSPQDPALGQRLEPAGLGAKHKFVTRDQKARFLLDLLVQDAFEPRAREPIIQAATAKGTDDDAAMRNALRLVLTAPEYQLA
jgi:uncharacterized protein (DUF1800 family)